MMIIAFSIVFLLPIFGVILAPVCLSSQQRSRQIWGGIMLAFMLAVIGYNFTPLSSQNTDFLRHISRMKIAENYTYGSGSAATFENLPLFYLTLKLFSQFDSPYCLPFFSVLVQYSALFIIIVLHSEHSGGGSFSTITGIISVVCLTSYLGFCSGVFQYLTFTLYVLFVYVELYSDKRIAKIVAWLGYISLLFLHSSATLLILIRVFYLIYQSGKKYSRFILVLAVCWSELQYVIIKALSAFSGNAGVSYLLSVIGDYTKMPSAVNSLQRLIRIMALVAIAGMAFMIQRKNRKESFLDNKDAYYIDYIMLLAFFTCGSFFQYDIFTRFIMLTVMMGAPVVGIYFKNNSLKLASNSVLYCVWIGFCGMSLVYYYFSAYTEFHFNSFTDILFTNGLTVLKGMFS